MESTIIMKCMECDNHRDYLVAVNHLSEGICKSEITILAVVENIGEYLISKEAQKRGKGLRLLGDIICRLPKNYLRQEESAYYITFFGERLNDTLVISDALYGLKVLSGVDGLSLQQVDSTLSYIFQEVFTQALVQKDRELVFTIFHNFINSHLQDLIAMNDKFLIGFLQAIEGEKDPRNLAMLFNLMPLIINHFNIESMVEEFFEVIACYFPVDYSPPPNDTRGITRDDLVSGLRKCLTSTTKFSENLIPLLLEKSESDLKSAKLDMLITLTECCKTYSWENFKSYYGDIWKSIRREVFSNTNTEVIKTAFSTLTSVFKTTSTRSNDVDEAEYETLITETLNECVTYLKQSDAQFFVPTVGLIKALSRSTLNIAERIFRNMFPMLLDRYTLSADLNHRRTSLDAINQLLQNYHHMHHSQDEGPISSALKSDLWTIYNGIMESNDPFSLKCSAVDGLATISLTKSLTPPNEQILDILIKYSIDESAGPLGSACLAALSKVSEPPQMSSIIINHSLARLKNVITNDSLSLDKYLRVVSAICSSSDIIETALPFLISQLNDGPGIIDYITLIYSSTKVLVGFIENSTAITCCITSIAKRNLSKLNTEFWVGTVLLPLVQFLLKLTLEDADAELHFKNVAVIYRAIVPNLSVSESRQLFSQILKSFTSTTDILNDNIELMPILSISLLEALFSCSRRDIFVGTNEFPVSNLVNKLSKFTLKVNQASHSSAELAVTAAKCLGSLLNKYPSSGELDEIIESVLEAILSCLKDSVTTLDHKNRMVQLLTWTTKSLIMRGHIQMKKFIDTLLASLDDEILCGTVAKEFHLIQRDVEDCFTKTCHANVGILYKQRFFLATYQKLIEGFNRNSGDISCNYLTALVCQLTLIPKEILMAEAPNLMTTLIKGLGTSDAQLLLAILSTLSTLIITDTNLIEKYCDTLLSYLVPLTSYQQSMKIRIEALRCLAQFTSLPTDTILKHKPEVIYRLSIPLDDHKRLVRKEAALARSCWCLVGC
ncbi:mms19 nucleotide excision repair [Chamberlinius hualienensis]